MTETVEFNLPKDIYDRHLNSINEIKFTQRQIDIMAFICNGRSSKKTAAFFSISPKTVEYHTNAIMTKLRCNSRESIIDFIEKSGKFSWINDYYMKTLGQETGFISELEVPLIYTKEQNSLAKNKNLLLLAFVISVMIGMTVFVVYQRLKSDEETFEMRSPALIIPTQTVLLKRLDLLSQIENSFKDITKGIHSIALTGMGGAGKTTLARLYAYSQKQIFAWEVIAETRESLLNSFENLANVLSKTVEAQNKLKGIKEIKKIEDRERELISFVSEKLKFVPNWLLIYDNVEDFHEVRKYFPNNYEMKGRGKIIVTTRDGNIHHGIQSIHVEELRHEEKLDLFIKIMTEADPNYTLRGNEETTEFLKNLPPFPLDIINAAHYLKITNTSYENYLKHLNDEGDEFASVQENLLQESNEYTKARYRILALSFKKILEADPDRYKLLLLISLLDPVSIPRGLLESFKGDILVDKLIYGLRKYSLIENQSNLSPTLPTFVIHRSTQAISLAYLTKNMPIDQSLLQEIANTLFKYAARTIESEDLGRMKILIPHFEAISKHRALFDILSNKALDSILGCLYFYLGRYPESQKLLVKSLEGLTKEEKTSHVWVPRAFTYLGAVNISFGKLDEATKHLDESLSLYLNHFSEHFLGKAQALRYRATVCRDEGHYKHAKDLFQESLALYQEHASTNYVGISRALGYMGDIERELGNYQAAKNLLEQSVTLYKEHFPDNSLGIVWNLAHLGEVYGNLGDHQKAKNTLEQSLAICKNHLPENHAYFPWILGCLGTTYSKLGQYEKAKEHLENSASLFKKNFGDNRVYYAWAIKNLGSVYTQLKDYDRARSLLQESLEINEADYGKDHLEVGLVLQGLAQVYFFEEHVEKAELLIERSLKILRRHDHPEAHLALELMADISLKKASEIKDAEQSQFLKTKANQAIKDAMDVVKKHFPEDRIRLEKLRSKLDSFTARYF